MFYYVIKQKINSKFSDDDDAWFIASQFVMRCTCLTQAYVCLTLMIYNGLFLPPVLCFMWCEYLITIYLILLFYFPLCGLEWWTPAEAILSCWFCMAFVLQRLSKLMNDLCKFNYCVTGQFFLLFFEFFLWKGK